jgi:hypothetical protein
VSDPTLPAAPEPTPQPDSVAPAPPTAPAPGVSQQPYGQSSAAAPKNNTLAVVSLVLSLVGLIFPVALGGIITGHIALGQIKRTHESGRNLALAGTVIGYVVCGLWIVGSILFLVFSAFLVAGVAAGDGYTY